MKAEFKIETSSILVQTKKQLDEYFTGNRKTFDIPLHPVGTDFQEKLGFHDLLHFKYFSFKNCHIAIPASNLSDYKAVRGMAILYF